MSLIEELERTRDEITDLEFTAERSLQVDRLNLVIDWLKEREK